MKINLQGQSSAESHHRGMPPRERSLPEQQQPYHRQAPPPTQSQSSAPPAAAAVDKQTDENVLEQLRNKNRYNPEELDLSQVERAR